MKILSLYNQLILESTKYGFFKDRAGIHDYDAILLGKNNELPKMYNGWKGEVKFMSKEEYFKECARLQNTSYDDQFRYVVPEKVKKIELNMSKGIKYDMPYLNYVKSDQEGRHRVMAASNLGQDKIPVLILYKEQEEEEVVRNNISDMLGVWDDLVEDGEFYYFKTSGSDWEVLDKLLRCIANDYDYYFLDRLIYLKLYPSVYPDELSLIKDKSGIQYVNASYINYGGEMEVSQDVLKLCVILKGLRNNSDVIYSIIKKGDDYYLLIPENISGDFDRYDSCKDMLISIGNQYYIDNYNLLSVSNDNSLYDINDNDINTIMKLFKKAN